jgi:hypothetical protein
MGASMPQDDVRGQNAASAPGRTTVPGVPHISSETNTGVAMMTARSAPRDEILQALEMEPEPEVEAQDDVPMEQRRVGTPMPRPSWGFFQAYLEVLDGDVRRSTLQGIMDVLDAEPRELGRALNNVGASPESPTVDKIENASLHILSQAIDGYKKQEMIILELEQQIMLAETRNLDAETESATPGLNVTDQIGEAEEELQQ